MAQDIRETRRERERVAVRLKALDAMIAAGEASCRHVWGPVQVKHEEFTSFEPDMTRPIAQGVHLRYEERAVRSTRPVWTRTCANCEKVERTTEQREVVTRQAVPTFPG